MNYEDTIAAISGAQGEGAIGIVRMSGPSARKVLEAVFSNSAAIEARKMVYGHIVRPDTKERIDEVMAVFLSAPKTYTKEDMAEIYCHGGIVATRRVLDLLLESGARLAEPGEFTLRAFLNGRIDLTQAESVVDVINAKTSRAMDCALRQLEGGTSAKVRAIIDGLVDILAGISVSIDYPEEDVEDVSWKTIEDGLDSAIEALDRLLENAEHSRFIREGARVSIVGRPNVGKSSLLNLLLGEARAIVTSVPGTTRDTIEELLNIGGYPVRLIDTAGIRSAEDEVEKIGVERAWAAVRQSDAVIFVADMSSPLTDEDRGLLEKTAGKAGFVVANKTDLGQHWNTEDEEALKTLLAGRKMLEISVLSKPKEALELVRTELLKILDSGVTNDDAIINERHRGLLADAREVLEDAKICNEYDLVELEIRTALSTLGEVIGENVDDDILHAIFSNFCLGK